MTTQQIQSKIKEAQKYYELEHVILAEERDLPATERRLVSIIDKEITKASEKYSKIYNALVADSAKNGWNIFDFEFNDFFDFETFEEHVEYAK